MFGPQPPGGFQTVQFRHLDVHQNGGVMLAPAVVKRGLAAGDQAGLESQPAQQATRNGEVGGFVVHDQDARAPQGRGPRHWLVHGCRWGQADPRIGRPGQPGTEAEDAALAEGAIDLDRAAHQFDQPPGDGKAEPGATIAAGDGTVALLKGCEQRGLLLRRHANAGVLDSGAHGDPCTIGGQRFHHHPHLALFSEFDGVADEVEQDLPQSQRVAQQRPR